MTMSNNQSQNYKEALLPPLWVVFFILIGCFFWIISELREIVTLLVISFAIAYLIEPLLRKLEKLKIRRSVGFFVILGLALIIISILIFTLLPVLQREILTLSENLPIYLEKLKNRAEPILLKLSDLEIINIMPAVQEFAPRLFSTLTQALLSGYSITLTLINLALLPFLIFYISMGFTSYRETFIRYMPLKLREQTNQIIDEIDYDVSAFVRGQILVCFILFVLFLMGLGFLQIELWFLVAFIAGFGNLIPYLGSFVGIIFASLMSYLTYGDFINVLYVLIVFGIVQFLEGTFITPKVIGNKVGLSPLMVILAIIIGGSIFGLLGIFLAVPGIAILRVLAKHGHIWLISRI